MNGLKRDSSGDTGSTVTVAPPTPKPLFEMSMQKFGLLTVFLPFFSLIVCFLSAVVFQYDAVSKTETCSTVPNMVPSISAVTGVSPQRYIWRVCIALHAAPRFVIGYMYSSYYMERIQYMRISYSPSSPAQWGAESAYRALVSLIFYVYTIENACLIGITYISNVENYPIHEKLFIVFMITSLVHELLTLIIIRWSHPDIHRNSIISDSLRVKCICFVLIMSCTAGLIYYYLMHRWYCQPGSFTMFSTFEYAIGFINMYFHYTAVKELGHCRWTFSPVLVQPSTSSSPISLSSSKHAPREDVARVNSHNNKSH